MLLLFFLICIDTFCMWFNIYNTLARDDEIKMFNLSIHRHITYISVTCPFSFSGMNKMRVSITATNCGETYHIVDCAAFRM